MTETVDPPQKYPPRHFFFLAFAVLVSSYAIYLFYIMAHLPYSGKHCFINKSGSLEVLAIDPGSPADLAGIKKGDIILQVGDQEAFWELQPLCSYQVLFRRGASTLTTQLTPDPPVFPYNTLAGLLFGLLLLFLGLTVYLKKPFDPAARIFFLLTTCLSAGSTVMFGVQATKNLIGGIGNIIFIFIAPLMLHFYLIFPERKKTVSRHPILLTLIYVPSLFFSLMHVSTVYRIHQDFMKGEYDLSALSSLPSLLSFIFLLIVIYAGIGLFSMAHTFITTCSSEVRKQLQLIFWVHLLSAIIALPGFYALFQDTELFLSGGRSFPLTTVLSLVLFFLSYLLAILKYRLMDIEIVISRSLTYFAVSGITVILYILLFGFFNRTLEFLIGKDHFATYLVSALIVAFLFRPLLIRIQEWIDKFFYREKYDLHRALETVSQALVMVRNPNEIFQKVFLAVDGNLHINSGTLWLQEQGGRLLKQISSIPEGEQTPLLSFEPTAPFAQYLVRTRRGLTQYQVRTDRRFEKDRAGYIDPFHETKTEIFLPLIYENTLLGIIGLGEKRSGDLYSSEDVGLLTTLAHHTAVAMENARAYHEIEGLNLEAEKKVQKIQQQREEILALQQRLLNENTCLREEIQQHFDFQEIIGSSQPMKDVLAMVEKIAPTSSTVFLRGESGTGKELIARAVHFNSPRREGPFVKVNSAAIPGNLLESELFGHERGAFTGAIKAKRGKFELADGGTLFLDEIGELGMDLQVKLLRVLQEKEFERVGGNKTIKADLRIIAATNRDMEKAISNGDFREDLFYRLNVIGITTPPLRDRREDIRELTIHFLNKFSREMGKSIVNIDPKAMDSLKSYHWPGNIRELANVLERAVVLGEGKTLSVTDLPGSLAPVPNSAPIGMAGNLPVEVEKIERQRILEALEKAGGNKSEAARILGLNRSTFNSKLRKFKML